MECQGKWFSKISGHPVPENYIKDTKIMFLGQLGDNLWSQMEIWQAYNTKSGNPEGLKIYPIRFSML